MTVKTWTMDPRNLPDGTVLFLGISYQTGKIYTYAALKATGVWYFTGTGKVPQAAGWGAVERWLERDNRHLEWVKIMSAVEDVYPAPDAPAPNIEGHRADVVLVDDPPPWNETTPYDADQSDYGPRYT